MIVTFGYITLFASAFPSASIISLVFIYFEARSDLFKLEKNVKRPFSVKSNNIGSWIYVLEFMGFVCIFTNIILFTYASDQIDFLFPWLAYYRDHEIYSVLTVFGIEHFLVAFVFCVRFFISTEPKWIKIFFERKTHKKEVKSF